jgi:predicted protein tyrosine phosphatase
MKKVYENISVGSDADCTFDKNKFVIHACKICYLKSNPNNRYNYLTYRKGNHLFLNLVDIQNLNPNFTTPIIREAIVFLKENKGQEILIHCNKGESRAPSIALLYFGLQERLSYNEALKQFKEIYHDYNPGKGITEYLKKHW